MLPNLPAFATAKSGLPIPVEISNGDGLRAFSCGVVGRSQKTSRRSRIVKEDGEAGRSRIVWSAKIRNRKIESTICIQIGDRNVERLKSCRNSLRRQERASSCRALQENAHVPRVSSSSDEVGSTIPVEVADADGGARDSQAYWREEGSRDTSILKENGKPGVSDCDIEVTVSIQISDRNPIGMGTDPMILCGQESAGRGGILE